MADVDTSQGPLAAVRNFFSGIFGNKIKDESAFRYKRQNQITMGRAKEFNDFLGQLSQQGIDPATIPQVRAKAQALNMTPELNSFSTLAQQFFPQKEARESMGEMIRRPVPLGDEPSPTAIQDIGDRPVPLRIGGERAPTSEEKMGRIDQIAEKTPGAFGLATTPAHGEMALKGKRQNTLLQSELEELQQKTATSRQLLETAKQQQRQLEAETSLSQQKAQQEGARFSMEQNVQRQQIAASKAAAAASAASAEHMRAATQLAQQQQHEAALNGFASRSQVYGLAPDKQKQLEDWYTKASKAPADKQPELPAELGNILGPQKMLLQLDAKFNSDVAATTKETLKRVDDFKLTKGGTPADLPPVAVQHNNDITSRFMDTLAGTKMDPRMKEQRLVNSLIVVDGNQPIPLRQAIESGLIFQKPEILSQLPNQVRPFLVTLEEEGQAAQVSARMTGASTKPGFFSELGSRVISLIFRPEIYGESQFLESLKPGYQPPETPPAKPLGAGQEPIKNPFKGRSR